MPKKVLFESAIHQLSRAGVRVSQSHPNISSELLTFAKSWNFVHQGKNKIKVSWSYPNPGEIEVDYKDATLYFRGDIAKSIEEQTNKGMPFAPDVIQERNKNFFDSVFIDLARQAGISVN